MSSTSCGFDYEDAPLGIAARTDVDWRECGNRQGCQFFSAAQTRRRTPWGHPCPPRDCPAAGHSGALGTRRATRPGAHRSRTGSATRQTFRIPDFQVPTRTADPAGARRDGAAGVWGSGNLGIWRSAGRTTCPLRADGQWGLTTRSRRSRVIASGQMMVFFSSCVSTSAAHA